MAMSEHQRLAMRVKRKGTAKARIGAHGRSHGRQKADSADQARLPRIAADECSVHAACISRQVAALHWRMV